MAHRETFHGVHARIEGGFERFARLIIRARWPVIAGMLAITLAFGSLIPQLRVDNSDESFLRDDDPARVRFDDFQKRFGREDTISIVFQPPEIFDLTFLEMVRTIHREIEATAPYVEEVTSLVNARNTRGEGDLLIVEDLMEDWPEGPADLAALRDRVFANPLYVNTLIAEKASLTVIAVKPFTYSTLVAENDVLAGFDDPEVEATADSRPLYLTPEETGELLDALRAIVEPYQREDQTIYVAGGAVIDQSLTRVMNRDIGVSFSLAIALIMLILFLLFRRSSGAILPLVVVVASVVPVMGAMVLLDIPFSITLNVLPALLLTVGICDAIHILAIVYRKLGEGAERDDAIAHGLGHSGLAVMMTSLTTAAGLFSFVTAELAAVAHLGTIAPIGVMAAMIYTLVLLPALLAVVPLKTGARPPGLLERVVVDRFLLPVGLMATRRPRGVLALTAGIVAVASLGLAQVRFSHDGVRWFPPGDPVRYSAELIDDEFDGTSSLEVLIDTGQENGLYEPAVLQRIERAMRWSETQQLGDYPVSQAVSIVDMIKEINQALNANDPRYYTLPTERALVAQELLLFENSGNEDLEDWTDSSFRTARLRVRTRWEDALLYPSFLERMDAGLREVLGDDLPYELTGGASIFTSLFAAVITSMSRSYVLALVVITPLLILLVGNLKRGLLAMIPNLIPVYLTLAVMGWLHIPLDASTLLIGGVVLGVAVDDTIHFMHKFNRYYEHSGNPVLAVEQTLSTTGTALLFTSLVLCAGFSVFMSSYLVNVSWFGMLAALAAAMAFLADVIVAPALMVLVSPHRANVEP